MTIGELNWIFCAFYLEIGCFIEETVLNCHRIVKELTPYSLATLGKVRAVFN